MAGKQRKVKAATVLAWWDAITSKLAENPRDMKLRGLENALYFGCRKNGVALERGVPGVPSSATTFDWEHGEMVFEVLQPEGLIAALEEATGIPEHGETQSGSVG